MKRLYDHLSLQELQTIEIGWFFFAMQWLLMNANWMATTGLGL